VQTIEERASKLDRASYWLTPKSWWGDQSRIWIDGDERPWGLQVKAIGYTRSSWKKATSFEKHVLRGPETPTDARFVAPFGETALVALERKTGQAVIFSDSYDAALTNL
jgi:hypothetical protein